MRYLILLLLCLRCSCSAFSASFSNHKLVVDDLPGRDSRYVLVIGNEKTTECLEYYKDFLVDSLEENGKVVEGKYDCCVNETVNLKERLISGVEEMLEGRADRPFVLSATIVKVVTGVGTTGERVVHLAFLDTREKKLVWETDIKVKVTWFIGDGDYERVARKLCDKTMVELRKRGEL